MKQECSPLQVSLLLLRFSMLTGRELEVLQAAARGERNKEIAYKLGITERTVKAHLASIYQKFNVDSRAAAVAVAAQKRLLGE